MPPEAPVEVQLALDFVAGRVNRRAGPGRATGGDSAFASLAELWLDGVPATAGPVERLIYLFPVDQATARSALFELAPGGLAGVIAVGGLGAIVDRARRRRRGCRLAPGWLRALRLDIVEGIGLGGPLALAWAVTARRAAASGRPALADRCEFQYRRAVALHRSPRYADIAVYVVHRPG